MFKLLADPTFEAPVAIPVAGGKSVEVPFTFKHRTKTQYAEWLDSLGKRKGKGAAGDLDTFLDMVVGWKIDEEFNRENAAILLEQRMGVAQATFDVYLTELTKAREKN